MKKYCLPTLVAMAAGMFCVQAQADSVSLYGLVDSGIDISRGSNSTSTRVISGGAFGSRLGFRGVEDFGGGLSAIFRLEMGINIDSGALAQGGLAFGREASVGLASKSLGTLQLGRLPTPYYSAQNAVDAFLWVGSGGLTAITRSGTTSQQILPLAVNARSNNALLYTSPKFANVELRALVSREEDTTAGKSSGLSARYSDGPLDLVAGYGRQNGLGTTNGKLESFVVGGSYNIGPARVYAGVTTEENSCTTCIGTLVRATGVAGSNASEFRLVNLGVRIPLGNTTAIAQVVRVSDRSRYAAATGDRDATWFAIGGEYALSKRTGAYATIGTIGNQNGSLYALGSGTVQQPANFFGGANRRSTTLTLGMRHNF